MADVQVEHGYTRIANALYEAAIAARLPGRHQAVLHAIIRLTYGYNRKADRIAVSQVANLTGIGVRHVRSVLQDLSGYRIITASQERGRPRRIAVNKDFEQWRCGSRAGGCGDSSPAAGGTPLKPQPLPRAAPVPNGTPAAGGTPTPAAGGTLQRQKDRREREVATPPATPPHVQTDLPIPGVKGKPRPSGGTRPTAAPEDLAPEEKKLLGAWCRKHYPQYRRRLRELVDQCLDHHRAKGKKRVDWLATCRNWIRTEAKFDAEKGRGPGRRIAPGHPEMPQDPRQRGLWPVPIGDILQGIAEESPNTSRTPGRSSA